VGLSLFFKIFYFLLLNFFEVVIGDRNSPQIDLYDFLLSNQRVNTLKTFHTKGIIFLKYLSLNGYVASCSDIVSIWNPNTGEYIQRYSKHPDSVLCLDQIDEDTMVSGSWDNTIHIWKISTGETLKTINASSSVYSIRSLSKGLIACGLDKNISIYEYKTGNLVQTLVGHSGGIFSIEILNEQFMTSGSTDKKVIIWDLTSYSIKYNLSQHARGIRCIKRLTSNLMASGDSIGLILIWNWLNGSLVYKLIGHNDTVSSLDLYDDKTLISGSVDQTFWNITNGQLIKTIHTGIEIGALVLLERGKKK
jgi:WD40 repeat protein